MPVELRLNKLLLRELASDRKMWSELFEMRMLSPEGHIILRRIYFDIYNIDMFDNNNNKLLI